MKYVFGPLPSRRLGQSLGIDPIPFKSCNWNCIYCQLGRSSPPTNMRQDFIPADEIIGEAIAALQRHEPGEIDWLTFAGSGEPTLHASLGRMIRDLKSITDIPIAVITNGSLFYLPEVRQELSAADAVLPSLDAGSEPLYLKIDRPMAELGFDQFVRGLAAFRDEFAGKYWVEVMLLKGLNDSVEALEDLAAVLRLIRPDKVHISLPIRPPCEPWVQPADEAGLLRAATILGEVARVIRPADGQFDVSGFDNVVEAVVAIIKRHPMREEELVRTLRQFAPDQVNQSLANLQQSGQAKVITVHGERHWTYAQAGYVDESLSRRHRGRVAEDG